MSTIILLLFLAANLSPQLVPDKKRDPAQVRAFRKMNPCPVTQKTSGACKGFVVDHIMPLCFGGADNPENMTWQEVKASYKKDVFERQACALKNKVVELKK